MLHIIELREQRIKNDDIAYSPFPGDERFYYSDTLYSICRRATDLFPKSRHVVKIFFCNNRSAESPY